MPLAYRWMDAPTLATMAASVPDPNAWWTFVHAHTVDADLLATTAELILLTAPMAGSNASMARVADAIQELQQIVQVFELVRTEETADGAKIQVEVHSTTARV